MKRLHIPNIDNTPAASRVMERGKRYLDGTLLTVPYTDSLELINQGVERDHSVGVDFEWSPTTGKVHSVGLSSFDYAGGFPLDEVIDYVRSVFSNPYIQVVGHNIVADVVKAIDFLGVPIRCKFLDTLILKRELAFSEYSRAEESLEFFSYYALFTEDFKYTNNPEFFEKPSKELFYRTAGDAWTGLILADWFYNKYKDHWHTMERAMELDMQMVLPVAYMIHDGITVDVEAIKRHQDILDEQAIKLMGTIQQTYDINPGSAAQVKDKFHELGYKIDGTGVGILSDLDHPLAELILNYRKTTKLSSSFLTNLPNMMDSDNRVHPHLAISGAVTGRLTSTKPAIQTIPPEVRDIYMSNFGDDGVLIDVDASQCVPLDTEILTRDGWKTYDKLEEGDETLGYSGKGRMEWTKVEGVFVYKNAQLVKHFHKTFSVECTSNHRFQYEQRVCQNYKKVYVDRLGAINEMNTQSRLVLSAELDKTKGLPISGREAAILGWLHSDAHFDLTRHTAVINQKKEKYIPVIQNLLKGIEHTETIRKDGMHQFYLRMAWVKELINRAGLEEDNLEKFVIGMNTEQVRAWLMSVYQADGWKSNYNCKQICKRSRKKIDAFALAGYLLGYYPRIWKKQKKENNKTFKWFNVGLSNKHIGNRHLKTAPSRKADVWCPKTELGTWTMRQEGKIMLTGNSEFRCLGYLACSRPIIDAYEKGTDFHSLSAELAGISRKDAKTLNFAYIYGASKDKLKEELIKSGVDNSNSYSILSKYMMIMSNLGIDKYQKYVLSSTYNKGYVESPNGRRGDRVKKQQAVNFPIQSFSSDLNKKRLIDMFQAFQSEGLVSRVCLEFHDSALLDVYLPEMERVEEIINQIDTTIPDVLGIGVKMELPIEAKVHGRNWS